jgi:hypothetical protein
MRTSILLICSTLAVAVFAISPAAASISEPMRKAGRCDTINFGGEDFVFFRSHMRCRTAKHYARHLHREPSWEPKRFDCRVHSGGREGSCEHVERENRFFLWYPEH